MNNSNVMMVPEAYKRAVKKEQQGTINEVSYNVYNYINSERQLVTNQGISSTEAGRKTIQQDAIMKICNVYLPAGYDNKDEDTKYNVLYLLHGVGGNCYEWLSSNGKVEENYIICNIFDNLIANGDIEPLIVVYPEGRSAHDWTDCSFNPEGTNMLGFYYFDYEMRYDLIPFIESEFHTYANINDTSPEGIVYNRLHRALAGLSMGGMQPLNLGLGGYRCDSAVYTGRESEWKNGLVNTVTAKGMSDLFAYVGAFSNAPTSSEGKLLGSSVTASGHKLEILYLTCGDADEIAYPAGYLKATNGITEAACDYLKDYFKVVVKDGVHDFHVWNHGAFNFIRFCFSNSEQCSKPYKIEITL